MRQCRHDAQSTSWRGGRSGEHADETTGEALAHIAHGVTWPLWPATVIISQRLFCLSSLQPTRMDLSEDFYE